MCSKYNENEIIEEWNSICIIDYITLGILITTFFFVFNVSFYKSEIKTFFPFFDNYSIIIIKMTKT